MKPLKHSLRLLMLPLLFCLPLLVTAQKKISGTIRNASDSKPVIDATVAVKGTSIGTTTDQAGSFSIEAREGQTLVLSSVGFETMEVPVTATTTTLSLSMNQTTAVLTDVVVVGYGTQRKENLTGAIASVGAERIEARPITNLGAGLQGLVPGLNINRVNGVPGQGASFNIRGAGSLNTNSPLILVDGVQMDPNLINPDDVETVTVLKDAASAAIYGVRAAFGVILITTKSPKKNAPVRLSYSGSFTSTRPTRMPEHMNSLQYITAHREADRNGALTGGGTASEKYSVQDSINTAAYLADPVNSSSVYVDPVINPSKYRYVGNTDWIDVLYPGWAPMTQHTISASGGEGKTSFVASMGYFRQEGLLKIANEVYQRFNPTLKVNTQATDWLDLNFKVTLNRSTNDRATGASHNGLSSGWIPTDLRPTMPVYHPDGRFSGQGNFTNMVALATLNGRTKNQINDLFLTGGAVLRPFKHVRVVADYTVNATAEFNQVHYREYKEYGVNGVLLGTFPWSTPSRVVESNINSNYHVFNLYADYENTFAGKHYLKAMAGMNQEYFKTKSYSANARNLIDQELPAINLTNDPSPVVGGYSRDWAIDGSFFRLNYIYNNKYLLEVNGRYDGSSRYQRGYRYTFLPSVSAGWRISEEGFFEGLKEVVNDLKLRASYGNLGNQITSPTNFYPYIPTMGAGTVGHIFGSTLGVAVNPPGLVSAEFTWEKVTTKNVGIDFGFFRNRLTGSFDAFTRDTKDILALGLPLPAVLGTAVPQINAASLRTKGFELNLQWRDRLGKDFSYEVMANLSDYTSKITRYDQNPNKFFSSTYWTGQRLNDIWGFVTEGYFQTDAEAAAGGQTAIWGGTWMAGDVNYADLNKDGKIDLGASSESNPGDRKVIGNSTPRYQFGFGLDLNYKGFDFNAFFQGTAKRDFALSGTYFFPFANDEWDVPLSHQLDYWTPANTNATYPRLRFGGGGNYQVQTRYLQDASYIRMKNIQLGYRLPASVISRAKLQRLRIYVSGENLFEITNLNEAFDPELLGATAYPLNRAISFGVQVGL